MCSCLSEYVKHGETWAMWLMLARNTLGVLNVAFSDLCLCLCTQRFKKLSVVWISEDRRGFGQIAVWIWQHNMSAHTWILPDFLDVNSGNHDMLHRVIACHNWKGLSKLIMAGWRNWGPERGKDLSKVLEIMHTMSRTLVWHLNLFFPLP